MINVTKTFLPPIEEYIKMVQRAWGKAWITNNGELVQELEARLKSYLGLDNLLFCTNGTVVLQIALKALEIQGEVITTPFSYVATTNAILWESCTPIFVDIDPNTFCIDAAKIEQRITKRTTAILATHVYGYPCNVTAIEEIAKKHGLRVIYDAAHAFGTSINGRSIFAFGDISTCSFHATKVFHTGEGGSIACNDPDLYNKLVLLRQFGHIGDNYFSLGTNGKNSELHAALGLCNLRYVDDVLDSRKRQWLYYFRELDGHGFALLRIPEEVQYNYSYFPLIFPSEGELLMTIDVLNDAGIAGRRYFYPSLNKLPYVSGNHCPISEDIAKRVLCLPMFFDLEEVDQQRIISLILQTAQRFRS